MSLLGGSTASHVDLLPGRQRVAAEWTSPAAAHVQVYLLECLAAQTSENAEEAESIITKVLSRLQHANSAVVLAAVKVVLCHLDKVAPPETQADYLRKLAAPLVTLLSQRPEVQYVALRNINLILQKHPDVLASEVRVFYCKYNDPIYVKLEKLENMVALASENNIAGVPPTAAVALNGSHVTAPVSTPDVRPHL